jgi:cation diffusion facilitator family transporter
MSKHDSNVAVWAALAGNVGVAVAKFIAAGLTGSAAMTSEAVHSLVDSINELLLLYGISRSTRAADAEHPLGYAREVYFWSFVVALLIFTLGAGVSAYEGIHRLQDPQPITAPLAIFVVLGISLLFEGASWVVGVRSFRAASGGLTWWQAFRRSKDPPAFIVVFEDSAALLGIFAAAAGTIATIVTGDGRWDGIASIVIALILTAVALLLGKESKGLLIGERADPQLASAIMQIAAKMPGVCSANSIATVHLAPTNVIATLSLDFFDYMRAPDIERAVLELEEKIRRDHPEVSALFVKPQSVTTVKRSADIMSPDDILSGG